ncbi:hypothetical protein LOZ54_000199 [Ophidiomyces ophidiicola]|nr:hypothetical protein LOZ54_000199 [Ophidiomyces ophidiicola]
MGGGLPTVLQAGLHGKKIDIAENGDQRRGESRQIIDGIVPDKTAQLQGGPRAWGDCDVAAEQSDSFDGQIPTPQQQCRFRQRMSGPSGGVQAMRDDGGGAVQMRSPRAGATAVGDNVSGAEG